MRATITPTQLAMAVLTLMRVMSVMRVREPSTIAFTSNTSLTLTRVRVMRVMSVSGSLRGGQAAAAEPGRTLQHDQQLFKRVQVECGCARLQQQECEVQAAGGVCGLV